MKLKYHRYTLFETTHWMSSLYQEPSRIFIGLGVDISEHGWRNSLFSIRFLIWEWDLEIDYSEPGKLSEIEELILSIKNKMNVAKKTVNR